jgi:hypothetical protein
MAGYDCWLVERPLPHYVHFWKKDSAFRCSGTDAMTIVDIPVNVSASVLPKVVEGCERWD